MISQNPCKFNTQLYGIGRSWLYHNSVPLTEGKKKKRLKEGRGGDVLEEDHTHPHLQVRTERIKLLAIPFSFQVL